MGGRRIAVFMVVLCLVTGLLPADPSALAQESGSNLVQDVTSTDPADGGNLALESVGSFDPNGGEAVFEPGTADEETFTYGGVDGTQNLLVDVTRPAPRVHPVGSFVLAGPSPQPAPSSEPSPSPSQEAASAPSSPTSTSTDPTNTTSESESALTTTETDPVIAEGVVDPICLRNPRICIVPEDTVDPGPLLELIGDLCGVDCVDIGEVPDPVETVCGPGLLLECLARVERIMADAIGDCPHFS